MWQKTKNTGEEKSAVIISAACFVFLHCLWYDEYDTLSCKHEMWDKKKYCFCLKKERYRWLPKGFTSNISVQKVWATKSTVCTVMKSIEDVLKNLEKTNFGSGNMNSKTISYSLFPCFIDSEILFYSLKS